MERRPIPTWRRCGALALSLAALAGVAACEVPDDQHQVRLRLDDAPPAGGAYATFANTGSAAVTVDVATRNAGTLVEGPGQGGSPRSVRFPDHDPATTSPRAVIRVVGNDPGGDPLNPGTGTFSFGADVRIDALNAAPGTQDDGNNVIQRGLFGSSQYKIQVDGARASCRIGGADGAVLVHNDVTIEPDVWYRLLCTREGDEVTIAVTSWNAAGEATTVSKTAVGATGDLTPAVPTVPLSVGGKLNDNGTVTGATDLFNGWIDNPRLRFHD